MKAQGGLVKAGRRYDIRGERGCELFIPTKPGRVIPRISFESSDVTTLLLKKLKPSEDDES